MQTFIMLTRLTPGSLQSPRSLEELERQVAEHIHSGCREVEWIGSYAILGPYDYVDIFRAPDCDAAAKVSAIVRSYGHGHTEIWAASEWEHFKHVIRDLSAAEARGADRG
jgi:uncharacterized protein with GYD domain